MSFIVWAHHMFMTGMGVTLSNFFQATTMIISIPSVIVLTTYLLTLWGASIRYTVPMLFALAFLPMFAIGGLTEVATKSNGIGHPFTRHLLCHWTFPLRCSSRNLVRVNGWRVSLVPKNYGSHDVQHFRKNPFLVFLYRHQRNFLPDVFYGNGRCLQTSLLYDQTVYAHGKSCSTLKRHHVVRGMDFSGRTNSVYH